MRLAVADDGNKFRAKRASHRSRPDKNYKDTIGRFGNSADLVPSIPRPRRTCILIRVRVLAMQMHLPASYRVGMLCVGTCMQRLREN